MKKIPLAIGLCTLLTITSNQAFAQDTKCSFESNISVVGVGEVLASPDLVKMSFTAQSLNKVLKDARDNVEKTISTFIASLNKANISKDMIQADSLYISPRYNYKDNDNKLIGYDAQRGIEITLDNIENIGLVIDLALKAGITKTNGFTYDLKDLDKYKKEALSLAIQSAKKKAQDLALGFDVKIDKPCSLSYGHESYSPYPKANMRMYASSDSSSSKDYVATSIPVRVEVNAIYSIK